MINFSEQERKICKIIKEHALSYTPIVTPRLAGGFVRDKIMGIQCHDIDVALDTVSGLAFAIGLSDKIKDHPNVHKILANPEKSKHLETAVINLHGYSIDFVHLRSESYTDTRIPIVEKGTPEEDAFRRDITINSLFYNLISEEVEDFTGRGMHDIQNKIIDTPLDPKTTLFDDPLRIIRIFRFKSRFGFSISNRIHEALKDKRLGKCLEDKVSNERNGIEIVKMLEHSNGEAGLAEIANNDLVFSVFKPVISIELDKIKISEYSIGLKDLLESLSSKEYLNKFTKKTVEYPILRLYLILQYFLNIKSIVNKKNEFVNVLIMKDGLKTKKDLFNGVKSIEECAEYILQTNTTDIVEIVVRCKEYWLEVLIILFLKFKNQQFLDMIFDIFDSNYHECYLETPLVNGDFLVSVKTDPKNFKQLLFDCFVLQVKQPELSPNEIYNIMLKRCKIE